MDPNERNFLFLVQEDERIEKPKKSTKDKENENKAKKIPEHLSISIFLKK